MKKLLAALSACVLTLLSFCIPASAAPNGQISDPALVSEMINVYLLTLGREAVRYCSFEAKGADNWKLMISPEAEKLYLDDILTFARDYHIDESKIQVIVSQREPAGLPEHEADYPAYKEKVRGYSFGDADNDGDVTLADALKTLKYYTTGMVNGVQIEARTGQEDWFRAMNVAPDEEIDLTDAQLILRYYTLNCLGKRNVSWVDIVVFGA